MWPARPVRKGRRKSSGSRLGRYYLQRSTQGNARPRDSRTSRCTHRSLWSARPARRCQRLRPVRIVREGRRTPPRALRALQLRRNPVTAIGSPRTPPTAAAAATIRSPSIGARRRQGSNPCWLERDRCPGLAAVRRPPDLSPGAAGHDKSKLGRGEADEGRVGLRACVRKRWCRVGVAESQSSDARTVGNYGVRRVDSTDRCRCGADDSLPMRGPVRRDIQTAFMSCGTPAPTAIRRRRRTVHLRRGLERRCTDLAGPCDCCRRW